MNFEGNAYEIDNTAGGAFNFFASGQKWAYSSTGAFQHDLKGANYLTQTTDPNVMSIYQTARLAPLSLKYFSLCLLKGSYNVKLHFAKIMFIGDQTFRSSSIGRRIFNVAIQGNEVLKDFEIAAEAGGARKAVTKEFKNVYVNGSTLEILLYWAGKGTTAVPTRSVYGPLISGLTVTPNFKIDSGLSDGAIAGTVVASSFTILVAVLIILRVMGYLGGKGHEDEGRYVLLEQGNLLELVDPALGSSYSEEEALRLLNIALLCTNPSPTLRPTMASVVSIIQGQLPVQARIVKCSDTSHSTRNFDETITE